MKFLVSVLLIALLSFAVCLYLPWWTIALVALIVTSLIHQSSISSFLSGFIALFILWSGLAAIINFNNEQVLARKISVLVIGNENPLLLIVLTGLLGGLIAGLGALAGSFIRKKSDDDDTKLVNTNHTSSIE